MHMGYTQGKERQFARKRQHWSIGLSEVIYQTALRRFQQTFHDELWSPKGWIQCSSPCPAPLQGLGVALGVFQKDEETCNPAMEKTQAPSPGRAMGEDRGACLLGVHGGLQGSSVCRQGMPGAWEAATSQLLPQQLWQHQRSREVNEQTVWQNLFKNELPQNVSVC